ncbi:MAG: hypothetical protein ACK5NQ_18920 [Pseudomonas sp.]
MGFYITETAVLEAVFQNEVSAAEIERWLAHVARLIEQRQPFYFISTTLAGSTFAEGYRAIQGVWYKRYKTDFQACCRGLVRVATDAEELTRLDTPALHAAWGVPYFVTLERAQGLQWIAERMVHDAAA